MSNFWQLSDGKVAEQTDKFDAGGGDVLPDNTDVLALIDEAGWKAGYEGAHDVIQLRWTVHKPDQFKGRKIFQKLKVNDPESKTSDKAKRMLMAIDTNAGGKLAQHPGEPNDSELMSALMNKPMVLKIKVWEINEKKGNWVAAVSPYKRTAAQAAPAPVEPAPQVAPAPTGGTSFDDDIPFAPVSKHLF